MNQLSLYSCLKIREPSVVSFFGAGGKTTLLLRLAAELISAKQKVLLTTTTKIYQPGDLPLLFASTSEQALKILQKHFSTNNIAVLGKGLTEDHKVEGVEIEVIDALKKALPLSILVEADGAKGKSLKGYETHEPVIPASSDLVGAVIGADAIGAELSAKIVHRLDSYIEALNGLKGRQISVDLIARTYLYMSQLGLEQAPQAKQVFILNKADCLTKSRTLSLFLQGLNFDKNQPSKLLVTSAIANDPVKVVANYGVDKPTFKVSAVILAAGTSSRMGRDKLALPLAGKTILVHTLENIRQAGVEDILVVVKPDHQLEKSLAEFNCRIIVNDHYRNGMSSSIKAGLEALDSCTQAVIFALGDQPAVSPAFYRFMLDHYWKSLKLITCPVYRGRRGNPTIFDRRTWPALMNISGDKGGRELFSIFTEEDIDYVETENIEVITDIDTPEDYHQALKNLKTDRRKC